jgi:hypothetical protein
MDTATVANVMPSAWAVACTVAVPGSAGAAYSPAATTCDEDREGNPNEKSGGPKLLHENLPLAPQTAQAHCLKVLGI